MIAGNLEYLVSSLPDLAFEDTQEIRKRVTRLLRTYAGPLGEERALPDIFDQEAAKFLSSGQTRLLRRLDLDTVHTTEFRENSNPVVSGFARFMYQLRDRIRQLRIARRNDPNQPAPKSNPLPISPGTPLEEEVQLLQLQWDTLEELAVGHATDFGGLVAYKLQLQILLRWWSFDAEKGFAAFTQITTNTDDGR